jgi:hypothetical protein
VFFATFVVRAQDIATNTTITVDCDFDCHRAFPFSVIKKYQTAFYQAVFMAWPQLHLLQPVPR